MRFTIPLVVYPFAALLVSALALPSQDLAKSAGNSLLASFRYSRRDESSHRKKLVECINKEVDKENSEFKIKSDELKKLKDIVDEEVMKEPLKAHSEEEQKRVFKEIEDGAKKDFPGVSTETIDKMMLKLKEMSMHCCKEMGD